MITFVTPVSPSHLVHLERCVQSVQAQTVPCQHVVVVDHDRLGPGNARNVGLRAVETEFVSFLDADDAIEPTFAEETLFAWRGRYLYTDWREGDVVRPAPACAWVTEARQAHLITAVVPTVWALEVGGFDALLPGGEDTDFFLRLVAAGHCGQRVARPLFIYGADGERSKRFVNSPDFDRWKTDIFERHHISMACCGQGGTGDMNPVSPNEHYVLVEVTELADGGTQRRRGRATGEVYDRVGIGEQLYVHPADADHPSGHFRRVNAAVPPPRPDDFQRMADLLGTPVTRLPKTPVAGEPEDIANRVRKVLDLWAAPKFASEPVPEPEHPDTEAHGAPVDLPPVVKVNKGGRPRKPVSK